MRGLAVIKERDPTRFRKMVSNGAHASVASVKHHTFTPEERRRGGVKAGTNHALKAPVGKKNSFRNVWLKLSQLANDVSGILLICDRRRRSIKYGLINTKRFSFACGDKTMNLLLVATVKLGGFLETGVAKNGLLVSEDGRFVYVFAGAKDKNTELVTAAKEFHDEWLRAIRGQYEGEESRGHQKAQARTEEG